MSGRPRPPGTWPPRRASKPRRVNLDGLVQSLSAAAGAAVVVGTVARKYWTAREVRQQAAFTEAVQRIVDTSVVDVIARQAAFETRQGQHLDKQDKAIADLRRSVETLRRRRDN